MKTGDLNDGIITEIPESITDLAVKETSVKLLPKGAVLVAMYGATIGKLGILGLEATTNQACCACIPFPSVLNWYLFYFLLSHKREFVKKGAGGAQPNISREKIIDTLMPLPPPPEQQRIVAKLEEVLPQIDKLQAEEEALAKLQSEFPQKLKNSLLQAAIQGSLTEQLPEDGDASVLMAEIELEKERLIKEGKIKQQKPLPDISEDEIPFEIPENWCWVRLGEIVSFSIGKTPSRGNVAYWGSGSPWVAISDMIEGKVIKETKETVTAEAIRSVFRGQVTPAGTLLMSFKLTIGRVSILGMDAVHNEAIISIFPFFGGSISRDYLRSILPYVSNWGDSKDAIKGKTLNSTSINALILPLPPLLEQQRIVARLEELLPLCDALEV